MLVIVCEHEYTIPRMVYIVHVRLWLVCVQCSLRGCGSVTSSHAALHTNQPQMHMHYIYHFDVKVYSCSHTITNTPVHSQTTYKPNIHHTLNPITLIM